MRTAIDDVLRRGGGVATRARLLTVVSRSEFDDEVRRGRLVSPSPRAYCRPWEADEPQIRERAALTSVGAPAALSHLTAVRRWDLAPRPPQVHLSVPISRRARPRPHTLVHRVGALPQVVRLHGLPTVAPAPGIITSWPMLPAAERRGPAITAVRQRLVTPDQLRTEVAAHPRLAGRAELSELIGLLSDGCESELEIWGCLGVFDVPGLRHGRRQHWVSTPRGSYRFDLAYVEERVAIEMDGDRYHSSREQRERDRRRDAACASIDWLTLRFSWQRLHFDVAGCRTDTLAALSARRRCTVYR